MSTLFSAPPRSRPVWPRWLAAAVALALVGGVAGWAWQRGRQPAVASGTEPQASREAGEALAAAGMTGKDRSAIEAVVRDYILAHPEILPEAMHRLQERGAAEQIAAVRGEIERPFPGAVLGNPAGKVTLVEFTDFACTFCRASVAEIAALTKAHPDLRVVIRETPILSPASHDAAKMALAAARQGRYPAFHAAMFSGPRPDQASIAAAAAKAGLDVGEARRMAAGEEVAGEVRRNLDLATRLGIQGTPAWVVGDRLIQGAVGRERLDAAIAEARAQG